MNKDQQTLAIVINNAAAVFLQLGKRYSTVVNPSVYALITALAVVTYQAETAAR